MPNETENLKERYRSKEMWNNYDKSGQIQQKVKLILDYIPEEVVSILDIGCGNGIITNELGGKFQVCGVDISEEALKQVKGETIVASADSIPVENNTWDMVFSSEMLEHLPDDVLDKTMDEIKRIARKYVFITVPNKEYLPSRWIRCPKCGNEFHIYGHLHSFGSEDIGKRLGSNFKLIRSGIHGPLSRDFNPLLLSIKHRVARRWKEPEGFIMCPSCKNTEYPNLKGNLLSKLMNFANRIASKPKPYWLFLLYEKKG